MEREPKPSNEYNSLIKVRDIFFQSLIRTRKYLTDKAESREVMKAAVISVFESNPNQYLKMIDIMRISGTEPAIVFRTVDQLFRAGEIEQRARYMGATLIRRVGFDPVFTLDDADSLTSGIERQSLPRPRSISEMHAVSPAWSVDYRLSRPEEDQDQANQPDPQLHA